MVIWLTGKTSVYKSESGTCVVKTIQVNHDLPIFGPVLGPENATLFQNVHDSCSPCVPKPQATLQHGGGCLLLLADNLQAPVHQILLLIRHLIFRHDGRGKPGRDARLKDRFSLSRQICHDTVDLLVGDKHSLSAGELCTAGRKIEHIPLAEQSFGSIGIEDHAAIDTGSHLKGDP